MNPVDQTHTDGPPAISGRSPDGIPGTRDQRLATAMGENTDWLRTHQLQILQAHPDWADKYVAVASQTPSKILAVADERSAVIEQGLQASELLELAQREGRPPDEFLTALLLDVTWGLYDR
jgi:hypothetical protein